MDDLTGRCLDEMRGHAREFTEKDLRRIFCGQCRNPECGHAKWAMNPWEARMATQEDRLLINPHFATIDDPRWASLREVDFPSLFRESIRVQLADQKGDWSVPTEGEVDAAMGDLSPDHSETKPQPEVEAAVAALRKQQQSLHTVIQVFSQTQPGVSYDVTVNAAGEAISCSCKAGKFGRRCTHRIWGEQEFLRRQRETASPPQETTKVKQEEEEALPPLGIQTEALQGLEGPLRNLAANTPQSVQGKMLGKAPGPSPEPVDGLRKISRDPWGPKPKAKASGVTIKLGKGK